MTVCILLATRVSALRCMYLVGYARVRVAHDYYAHCEAELIYKRSITTLAERNLHRAELEPFLLNAAVAGSVPHLYIYIYICVCV